MVAIKLYRGAKKQLSFAKLSSEKFDLEVNFLRDGEKYWPSKNMKSSTCKKFNLPRPLPIDVDNAKTAA